MNKIDVKEVVFIFILFMFLIGLIMVTPFINRFRNDGELIINEVMSSNSYTIMDIIMRLIYRDIICLMII